MTGPGAPPFQRNVAQCGDARALLQSLPESCAPLAFFDPQHRSTLDRLKYGNEGARQKGRARLPAMADPYIDSCCREVGRVLTPLGYLMLWEDAFRLLEGYHLRIADVLKPVGLIAWDKGWIGNGSRERHRGDYLVALQKPRKKKPYLVARATWRDRGIPDRWIEKIDRRVHPHLKPAGLITRLIAATTNPGDLVVDPAAGSFAVMHAALALGRDFLGCDLAYAPTPASAALSSPVTEIPWQAGTLFSADALVGVA
jgi:site-specific DNA-methyltransferase (adenine-specific)